MSLLKRKAGKLQATAKLNHTTSYRLGFLRGVAVSLSILLVLILTPVVALLAFKPAPSVAQQASDNTGKGDNGQFYDMVSVFSEVFNRVRSDYVEQISATDLVEKAIDGMLARLDPYSAYFNERDFKAFNEQSSGQFGGLGMEVAADPSGYVKIVAPIDDTPAARAGLKSGDFIMKVDGKPVQGKNIDEVVRQMRGAPGTTVNVTFIRQGLPEPFTLSLKREKIVVQSVKGELKPGGLGYVRMTGFTEQTAPGVTKIFNDLKAKNGGVMPKGFVLDLRNNPGGLLDQAITLSDDFLNQGEIVSIRGRDKSSERRFLATPGDISGGAQLVVLVNGGSASASEIFAGAMQDQKRAVVMGTTSFGKGLVQSVYPLSKSGTAMKLTTQKYYTPSGKSIQGVGIKPDIDVKEPVELVNPADQKPGDLPKKDPQLDAALAKLKNLVKSAGK
ncbi:MAG: S41 family peptidase [Hydrotalea sp.]|nr:S41 family peptidase [Hydrotalea sp.]